MALFGKISIIFYIILFFVMIEKSTCTYELARITRRSEASSCATRHAMPSAAEKIRSPSPIRGILYICTEENMRRKVSTCILCKGPDLSCFSPSSTTTTSTTTSTTKPSTSTTSTSTEPAVTTSSTTTKEPAAE